MERRPNQWASWIEMRSTLVSLKRRPASFLLLGTEHEVMDDQLDAAIEQAGQRERAARSFEA